MALNTSQSDAVAHRRRQVAALRLRGLTCREIVKALGSLGCVRADGRKYSLATVAGDLKFLRAEWREARLADVIEAQSAALAEIREARRLAWKREDLGRIERLLKAERELLGLDAPIKFAPTTPAGDQPSPLVAAAHTLPTAALEAIVALRQAHQEAAAA